MVLSSVEASLPIHDGGFSSAARRSSDVEGENRQEKHKDKHIPNFSDEFKKKKKEERDSAAYTALRQKNDGKLISERWERILDERSKGSQFYKIGNGSNILSQHLDLFASIIGSYIIAPQGGERHNYYWDLAKAKEGEPKRTKEIKINDNMIIEFGLIGDFSPEVMALVVDVMFQQYAEELLQIEAAALVLCPEDGQSDERAVLVLKMSIELLLNLAQSFTKDYVVMINKVRYQGEWYLSGSVGAIKGDGNRILTDKSNNTSTIPTMQSLSFDFLPKAQADLSIEEGKLAEVMRLNAVSKTTFNENGWEIIKSLTCLISLAVAARFPDVKAVIFNTKQKLRKALKGRFGILTTDMADSVKPTDDIIDQIYGYYFDRVRNDPTFVVPQFTFIEDGVEAAIDYFRGIGWTDSKIAGLLHEIGMPV